ncbi:type II RES/Xre toxin-antitoxin system antitoxin [Budvicia diplopodorum]|uniref:type II RES/Xre toxin-antitoxin system antitoxin n=1 Tax=Budvicia diplopodorum TaxID=1119056 RepID=UPI00135859A9|nr:antitoxin Xre/MbcA/ParS toxin-binding domain-containing protein [Budvicia diplopodorum]
MAIKSQNKITEPVHNSHAKLWQSAGLPASGGIKLINAIQKGLPVDIIAKLNNELDVSKMYILNVAGINERSFARRKNEHGRLKPEESERVARLVRIMDSAITLFEGDKNAAVEWINTPSTALGSLSPKDMLATETGALEVSNLIGRLEHGVFS